MKSFLNKTKKSFDCLTGKLLLASYAVLVIYILFIAIKTKWFYFPIILAIYTAFFIVYFIPYIVSSYNPRNNKLLIFLLNLFLGWTIIGWFITWALVLFDKKHTKKILIIGLIIIISVLFFYPKQITTCNSGWTCYGYVQDEFCLGIKIKEYATTAHCNEHPTCEYIMKVCKKEDTYLNVPCSDWKTRCA